MLNRMRADFQLTIITLFASCTVLLILPFAVYRFLSGALVAGVVDTTIVLCICAAAVYAWRSGDTRRAGMFLVAVNTVGTMAAATILGAAGIFWMYPTLLANFFLVDRRLATVVSAAALLLLAVHGQALATGPLMISFVVTASLVSLFAYIFATRTESQRLQLEALATHDPLTGVSNRRAMEQELQNAVQLCKRSRAACGLVMLDLDHFKNINDRDGHEAGDRVLIAFAKLVRTSTREVDRLFRFGGEEFVLLLPGTDVAGLRSVTEKLRGKIAAQLLAPSGQVTSSLGAAALRPDEDWQAWLSRADAALYRAKGAGRNCAVVDDADAPPTP